MFKGFFINRYLHRYVIFVFSIVVSVSVIFILNSCSNTDTVDSIYKYENLDDGSIKYEGFYDKLINFTKDNQLLNKDMWKQFVDVYKTKEDTETNKWRCEYWGKTMRGAVLCYRYDQSEDLYNVLEETVKDLLSTQNADGSFSTYEKNNEFHGWDIWGRKYVMTSLLSFYDICKDQNLKSEILNAVKSHANCIINKIGKDSNKIDITSASDYWLGVNSSSILEPFVNLYQVTSEQNYLDFAKYIIDCGGIRPERGNLLEICKYTSRLPYQYPESKAYETMSFFEGVYKYALVVNDKELRTTALKFFDDVQISEITVIGNAGNNEELFSNAKNTQTIKPDRFGQETCVAVTWMRIQDMLYRTTGNLKYYENLTTTAINAFLGCVNYFNQGSHDIEHDGSPLVYLPFDSYSPLLNGSRGIAAGGLLNFNNPLSEYIPYYGCCACIASAAVGLIPRDTIVYKGNTVILNDYYDGYINDNDVNMKISGNIFVDGKIKIENFSVTDKNLELRIPTWAIESSKLIVDGTSYEVIPGTYFSCEKKLNNIKNIEIIFKREITRTDINDKVTLSYGNITLGIDTESNPNIGNLEDINFSDIDIKHFTIEPNQDDDLVRISVPYKNSKLLLKSYCSCGKHWEEKGSKLTVFFNNK